MNKLCLLTTFVFIHPKTIVSFSGDEGGDSSTGRYPYMVTVMGSSGNICGGSLIDSKWVISSAHCADTATQVKIGRPSEMDVEIIEVANEYVHPHYDPLNQNNDLLMLELNSSSSHAPVSLYSGPTADGDDVTVIGWDRTSSSDDVLTEAKGDILENSKCAHHYISHEITNKMVCASWSDKQGCWSRDVVGPIIFKGDDAFSDLLVGVASWGESCAGFPEVYARIDFDFINKVMNLTKSSLHNINYTVRQNTTDDHKSETPWTLRGWYLNIHPNRVMRAVVVVVAVLVALLAASSAWYSATWDRSLKDTCEKRDAKGETSLSNDRGKGKVEIC